MDILHKSKTLHILVQKKINLKINRQKSIFSFLQLEDELLDFLGWTY